jgi:hypothetical protein
VLHTNTAVAGDVIEGIPDGDELTTACLICLMGDFYALRREYVFFHELALELVEPVAWP